MYIYIFKNLCRNQKQKIINYAFVIFFGLYRNVQQDMTIKMILKVLIRYKRGTHTTYYQYDNMIQLRFKKRKQHFIMY
jgi:hypothetical protein